MTGCSRLLPIVLLAALAHAAPSTAGLGANPLAVDTFGGYLELGVRGRNDRRTRADAGTDFNKDQLKLEEILHLESAGSIWYPRLLRYRASADLTFLQEPSEGSNLILPGGDLRLNFLEKKPYGLTLFGRIVEHEIDQVFAPNSESRLIAYGGGLRFLLGSLPFRVRYTHRSLDRTGDALFELEEVSDEVSVRATYRWAERSDGDVRYEFSDQTLRGQPTKRHDFLASNLTYFDAEKRMRFSGRVRYYDRTGRTDTSDASVLGAYDWRHTDTLSSRYHLDFAHRTFDEQSSNLANLRTSLSHQLYGSLASSGALTASIQEASSGHIGEYGLGVVERYSKRLGRFGKLGIGLGPYVRLQQLRPDQDTAFVLDERVTFPLSERVDLRQLDIETASIVVTSTDGAITYQEGFDYLISVIDRRTEIERIDLGSIPVGGEVRVDYRYETGTDNDVLYYGTRADVQWSYRDWGTLFADVSTKREEVVGGRSDRRRDNRDRQEVGFRTSRGWMSALISFDWERWDQRGSEGNLQTVTLSTPWPGRFRGALSATHRSRDFTEPNEQLESWRVLGNFNVRVGRNGTIEINPEYSNEDWDGDGSADGRDLESVGGTVAFRWFFRSLELRASGSVHYIVRPGLERVHDSFFFWVRRHF